MRFRSSEQAGFQVFAVSGVNTVSFAISASAQARNGLLGFAVQRALKGEAPTYRPGFKVFPSIIPHPDKSTRVSTKDHPIQSLVWDDFTATPGTRYEYYFHPIRGTPRRLDRSAPPVRIAIRTEPLFSTETHDVFFNRGVASSQAYADRFGNKKPDRLPKAKAAEARQWLSRELDDAILKFIASAKPGDGLACCFYEFRYLPVVEALAEAVDRGVKVQVIIDAKQNGKKNKKTKKLDPPFPRKDNLAAIKEAGFPLGRVTLREARKSSIQHNKFMVLVKDARTPTEVWTGSTNISDGGIHGQTNVGHWVRDPTVAEQFFAYWQLLQNDPGGMPGDARADVTKANKVFTEDVEALHPAPSSIRDIPKGITPIFSPRTELDVLDLYFELVDSAKSSACITLAFGVSDSLKKKLTDNTPQSPIVFMLLEKEDRPKKPRKNAKKEPAPFIRLSAKNNVYAAFGAFLKSPIYQWVRETNTQALKLNQHVAYIHSKFLLRDPLGDDPIIVTGSANFSDASTKSNDENMVIIRGDRRAADIYFTEFNRLFNHYYFRAVAQKTAGTQRDRTNQTLFLQEKPEDWLVNYKPGTLRTKRVEMFRKMTGVTAG